MKKNGWIMFYHRVASEPKWRGSTLAGRGLWASLFAIAGATDRNGFIEGTDKEIAGLVGVTLKDFRRAWAGRPPGIERAQGGQSEGITFPNWQQFQHSVSTDRQTERQKDRQPLTGLPEDLEWWSLQTAKFPTLDLVAELDRAQAWLDGKGGTTENPKLRFLNWLTNEVKWQKERGDNIVHLPNLDLGEKAIVG